MIFVGIYVGGRREFSGENPGNFVEFFRGGFWGPIGTEFVRASDWRIRDFFPAFFLPFFCVFGLITSFLVRRGSFLRVNLRFLGDRLRLCSLGPIFACMAVWYDQAYCNSYNKESPPQLPQQHPDSTGAHTVAPTPVGAHGG